MLITYLYTIFLTGYGGVIIKFEKVVESHTYDRFGEILYILHKNNRKYLNDSLAEHDLNLLQAMCMLILLGKETCTQKELTEFLFLTKSGVTKAITELEKDGYISKEKSPSDSRQYVLRLTKKGMEMIPTLIEINNRWEEEVGLNDLDDEFFEKLKTLAYNAIELNEKNQ